MHFKLEKVYFESGSPNKERIGTKRTYAVAHHRDAEERKVEGQKV